MTTRTLIKSIAPPILVDAARRARDAATGSRAGLPVWELVPEGWERAKLDPHVKGWNVEAIRDWHVRRFELWANAFEAPQPLGSSEYASDGAAQNVHPHNVHVTFAYVLSRAASGRSALSILDWGGGVGQHALLAREVLPEVDVDYHCKDLPLVCAAGRELNPAVEFYDDEACLEQTYDVIVASNSLQYSERWQETLRKLAAAADEYLYVAQLPSVATTPRFVAVQRPYAYGFDTEYLGWIFNRDEFLSAAEAAQLELEREFFYGNPVDVHGVDEPAVHVGYLFRAR